MMNIFSWSLPCSIPHKPFILSKNFIIILLSKNIWNPPSWHYYHIYISKNFPIERELSIIKVILSMPQKSLYVPTSCPISLIQLFGKFFIKSSWNEYIPSLKLRHSILSFLPFHPLERKEYCLGAFLDLDARQLLLWV